MWAKINCSDWGLKKLKLYGLKIIGYWNKNEWVKQICEYTYKTDKIRYRNIKL